MKKVIKAFSLLIISLSILSVFGWMVFHITEGDKNFGFITKPVRFLYTFPDLFKRSVEEVKSLPKTYIPTPKNFEPINKLDSTFLILSTYSDTNNTRSIVLMNLKDDSIFYKWTVDNPYGENRRIKEPILFPNRNLVFSFEGASGLRRIDSLSNIIWKQDSVYAHHSKNLDGNGDIWACTTEPVNYATGRYKLNGSSVFYKDNYITKIDSKTGKILFHKSITELLAENGVSNYILKSELIGDPIHVNDIEPALKSTRYYNEGDLFISVRNPSIIIHYNPANNEIRSIIEGPFVSQHDVDILNDSTLILFNNNNYTIWSKRRNPPPTAPKQSFKPATAGDFYSNIVRYDFNTNSFSFIGDSIFRENKIFTGTEGLVEFIDPQSYIIEEQDAGILWIISNNKVIYKNVLHSQHEGYHHLTNWIRVIDNYD